jgi:TolB-like protein/Tfp pilus assembly protein PilF
LIAVCFINLELPDEAHKEMLLYKKLARQEMPFYPRNNSEWRGLWRKNLPYRHEEDFDEFFDHLLTAGLFDKDTESIDEIPSIAVLPFENMSDDPEQEFFSDGITADIISTLSKFRHLRIVARHSTEIYRNRKLPIAEIAQQQQVRYILEGSVRRIGKRIRVSAELIDSESEQICWSDRFDRDLDDLFAVQDEITQKITLAMKVHLDDGDMALQRSAGTTNIKAWELTMTAIDLQDTYIRQNILEARAMVNQALALDPDYVFAWVALAWTHWQEVYSGWSKSREISLTEAEKASQRALDLDPHSADALSQAGTGCLLRHDADKALEYCHKAIDLEPGNAENQALLAFAYIFVGDYEQARLHYQNVHKLCPILPNWYYLIGAQVEQNDGDLERAIAIYRQGLAVEPDAPLCRFYLVNALMQKGDTAGAQQYADEIRALDASVNGSGLVHTFSQDARLRDEFHENLAKFNLV